MDSGWFELEPNVASEVAALDWLERRGEISTADISHAETLRNASSKPVLFLLNQIGVLTDDALADALSKVTELPIAAPPFSIGGEGLSPIGTEFLKETQSLLSSDQKSLYTVNPISERMLRGVEFALGSLPNMLIIRTGDWLRAFQSAFPENPDDLSNSLQEDDTFATELADHDRDAPIVRQVSSWLGEAADLGASDVHLEARKTSLDVHYRIDGVLQKISSHPKGLAASAVARIKVIAELDLGERNKSQDGRATIVVRGRRLDVRVSIIPTIDGESAVVRILDRPENLLSLQELGFSDDLSQRLGAITQRKQGLFIVAGPTGSGKTTTLYACLETLKGRGLKILSVEDPVEYHFDHVNQVQISEKAGRDFAGALRSFLRHDPDVILVGEIRDSETAEVAIQAALSSHLVLATLHAIDTSRVRTRLLDMGIEPFKLDACLVASMAQRLVRRLCENCKIPAPLTEDQRAALAANYIPAPEYVYRPDGCPKCRNEGFSGRTALAELARSGESAAQGENLLDQGLKLVTQGTTSFSEIAGLDGK